MSVTERVLDAARRNSTVGKWKKRIATIKKKNKTTMRGFCRDHKLDVTALSRHISGRVGASWDTIRRVEKALEKEEKKFA